MFEFRDVQEAATALPDLQFEYQQLQGGHISVEVDLLKVDALHVTYVRLDRLCEGLGQVLPGRLVFLVCRASPQIHMFDNNSVHESQLLVTRGGRESHSLLRPGFGAALFNIAEQQLARLLAPETMAALPDGAVFDLSPATSRTLLYLEQEALRATPSQLRQLGESMALCLCHALDLPSVRDYPLGLKRRWSVARAIRDRLRAPDMTWGDICQDLAISERTFRKVFAEAYDISPGQYQLAVRLNRVREELKCGLPRRGTICEAACRHGFWHMGRFGSQYRRLFGETPRETLLSSGGHLECPPLGYAAI